MNKKFMKKLAKRVVWSMNMKEGETFKIGGGLHEQDIIEEIALTALENGVDTSFSTASDEFSKEFYKRVHVKHMKKTSRIGIASAKIIENRLSLESPKDPRIMENVPNNKRSALSQSSVPIRNIIDKRNVKWCYLGYPTKEMASKLGIGFPLLKKFIFKGTMINPDVLMKKSHTIMNRLKNAKYVHVHDEHGTDLKLVMGKRKIMSSDGYISDKDIKNQDVGLNLPDGEVFTTPIETKGNGILISPKRRDYFTGKMIENVKMVFENGRLNMQKSSAEKNYGLMKKSIKTCMAIDKKSGYTIRTSNMAELGIGLNPVIDKIIGYLLTDEKIGGTIHVAIGDNHNKAYAGKSRSCMHWDFITNKGVNLDVIKSNGKTVQILEKGRVVK